MPGQGGQEAGLGVGQGDRPALPGDLARGGLHAQRSVGYDIARPRSGAAHDGAGSQGEFARREGLGDVVVRAGLQACDSVLLIPQSRQQDDGDGCGGADPPAQLHPAQPWEHDVEHDQVE